MEMFTYALKYRGEEFELIGQNPLQTVQGFFKENELPNGSVIYVQEKRGHWKAYKVKNGVLLAQGRVDRMNTGMTYLEKRREIAAVRKKEGISQ